VPGVVDWLGREGAKEEVECFPVACCVPGVSDEEAKPGLLAATAVAADRYYCLDGPGLSLKKKPTNATPYYSEGKKKKKNHSLI
jgi:hypothetical protein